MRPARVLACGVALLVVTVALSLAVGNRALSPATVVGALFDRSEDVDGIVRGLRLPRTLIGAAAGAALGIVGVMMQAVTRNPVADPGILGVNSGASLFVVAAITWFEVSTPIGFVWFAFAGAAVATVLVYLLGSAGGKGSDPVRLALAGAALTAAITSLISLVLLTERTTLDQYRFWAVGSLTGRDAHTLLVLCPFVLVGLVLAFASARGLNALALGSDVARGLGTDLRRTQLLVLAAIVLLAGSAAALAGPIAFVGLVVAHLARRVAGFDHRWILGCAALFGAALLLIADVVGRVVAPTGEVEAGVVVAFLGAPALIALARTRLRAL